MPPWGKIPNYSIYKSLCSTVPIHDMYFSGNIAFGTGQKIRWNFDEIVGGIRGFCSGHNEQRKKKWPGMKTRERETAIVLFQMLMFRVCHHAIYSALYYIPSWIWNMMMLKIVGREERANEQEARKNIFLLKLHIFLYMKRVMIASHLVIYYTDRVLVVCSHRLLLRVHLLCCTNTLLCYPTLTRTHEHMNRINFVKVYSFLLSFFFLCCCSFLLKLWWCRYFRFFRSAFAWYCIF